ncbi:MAG: threonine synthase [Kiritimatiellae bacterium]|nr:threonine synthase [Kiritimatiellia bacterium]
MKYTSTRGGGAPVPFAEAVATGLARDGGLLLPESFPDVRSGLSRWSRLPFAELAFEIARLYADDVPEADLRAIIEKSYAVFSPVPPAPDQPGTGPEPVPVRPCGPVHVLELYHGPTLAFKDVALQFLGNLFEWILARDGGEMNVVVATSGDTGSAAIHGLRGRKGVRVFVLHPAGRVSPVQERQMTTVLDPNVFNIALDGTFDDAQAMVKTLFSDLPFKDSRHLAAVNSINWARVLAQVTYYFYAAFRTMERTGAGEVSFSVPTGNFGDVFAGYVAWKMGLPVRRLVLATNENDILARFFETGRYAKGKVVPTISPSMDIQVASNFERWLYLHTGRDAATVRGWMERFAREGAIELEPGPGGCFDPVLRAGRADTAATLETIRRFHSDCGRLLDPHTAVGVAVALEKAVEPGVPVICLSTAHPAKFPDAVARAIGDASEATHPSVEALAGLPARKFPLPNDPAAVARFVDERVRA